MTNPMPVVEFDAPAVNPAGLGLYAAATVFDTARPSRILAGVNVRPYNCSEAFGTWPTDPCADPDPELRKFGVRPESGEPFEPLQPWAYDECGPGVTDEESRARAAQTLRLQEPLLVESAFATRLLADAGAVPGGIGTATDLADAIGQLEVALGETGYQGYIHASRYWAPQASQYRWDSQTGAVLKTPLRHSWVFGGGYASVLGNTLVATGPVFVWRDELTVNTTFDYRVNIKASVAERTVVVGYECIIAAVTIGGGAGEGKGEGE